MNLTDSLSSALEYCKANRIEVPADLTLKAYNVGAIKAAGDLAAIGAAYRDIITESLIRYFEGGNVTSPRNAFKRGMVEAFGAAFDTGWRDGGGTGMPDVDALAWFNPRVEAEFGFIDMLFAQIKDLRKDGEFDYFSFVTQKADGYVRTLRDIYNMGKMFASKNKMLTFDGEDGKPDNICQSTGGTCVRLKGQRHRASWWISHGLVPYRGNPNYDCGAWECRHYLRDDDGNRYTE